MSIISVYRYSLPHLFTAKDMISFLKRSALHYFFTNREGVFERSALRYKFKSSIKFFVELHVLFYNRSALHYFLVVFMM